MIALIVVESWVSEVLASCVAVIELYVVMSYSPIEHCSLEDRSDRMSQVSRTWVGGETSFGAVILHDIDSILLFSVPNPVVAAALFLHLFFFFLITVQTDSWIWVELPWSSCKCLNVRPICWILQVAEHIKLYLVWITCSSPPFWFSEHTPGEVALLHGIRNDIWPSR